MRVSALKSVFLCAGLCLVDSRSTRADSISEERLELLFRPLRGDRLALSTDGHYLAYTEHVGTDLNIVVYDLESLKIKTRIVADEDRPIPFSKEKERTQLRFLDWANGHRLVFAPTIEVVPPALAPRSESALASMSPETRSMAEAVQSLPTRYIAPVMAVNADGSNPVDLGKKYFAGLFKASDPTRDHRETVPNLMGFDTGKFRDRLLLEIRGGAIPGTPTLLFRLNVEDGKNVLVHRQLGVGPFIYDRAGQPRLRPLIDTLFAKTTWEYRAPEAKQWLPVPEPPAVDGSARFSTNPETYFDSRVTLLGFDFDPNVLLYASNVGRDTFGIYGMNLRTRERTNLAIEAPHRDLVSLDTSIASSPLLFDKFREKLVGVRAHFGPRPLTVWLDADLDVIQQAVEKRFPERSVQVEQGNEARTRFIVRTTGGTDPGSLFLVRRPEGSMTELTRAAPWLNEQDLHETRFFDFTTPNGAQLTGHLTLPRQPRIDPPPLIIWFAPGVPPRSHPEFDPQAQVLADMGFVVCRLNQRGVLGLGIAHREALRQDLDRASADDALAALEWIAQRHRIDRKRVVTLGADFGGHLALRASQLFPEVFRCVVVFDPIIHLASWVQPSGEVTGAGSFHQQVNALFLGGSGKKLEALSVTAHAAEWKTAVFAATQIDQDPSLAAGVADLRSQLRQRDLPFVAIEYNQDFTLGLPAARARVYRALEEFINLNLYHYDVKIGPTKPVP